MIPLHEEPTLSIFTILYLLIFLIGFFGNLLTIVVVRRTSDLQSNTNFFLCNLAISDLLLLASGIPFDLIYMWRTYPAIAGSWHCILKAQFSEMASNVSILTILILTIERWIAICRPLHLYIYFNKDRILKYVIGIWIIGTVSAFILSQQFAVIPYFHPNKSITYENVTQCDVDPNRSVPYIFEAMSVVFFIVPMIFIVGAYGWIIAELNQCQRACVSREANNIRLESGPQLKARFLVIIMLIAVASIFFICFLPLHIQRVMITYDKNRIRTSQSEARFNRVWYTVAGLLHFVSAATNPILYNVMSRRFRLACRSMIIAMARWCSYPNTTGTRCLKNEQSHVLNRNHVELVPAHIIQPSTQTTSFKGRFALWLYGERRWNSYYMKYHSMEDQSNKEQVRGEFL